MSYFNSSGPELHDDDPDERHWRQEALCSQIDPDLFFPAVGESARTAKVVCRSCLVQKECLEYALLTDQRFGVWGGMTTGERMRCQRANRMIAEFEAVADGTCGTRQVTELKVPVKRFGQLVKTVARQQLTADDVAAGHAGSDPDA
ncbi:WhiB family transcriptional regulator [Nocardia inohanensis]|uniref:WhiB family transcriptional regulator n=1 Tax=Nocardia inohanensis TaxID=209246 RepID=UPI000829EDA0|nr:WhiB family transcriptional regulator [Nocardia inohanensis]